MRARATLSLLLCALLTACSFDADTSNPDEPPADLVSTPIGPDGVALTTTIAANAWVTHTFEVTALSDIDAVLDWSTTTVNLNLFLYDPTGALVVYSNGPSTRPETVSYEGATPGTWKIGIKNKSSTSTVYSLSVTTTPIFVARYPAQPVPGTVFWGASIGGNSDPVARHEVPSGHVLSVHRTFWQWTQRTGSMITTASDDIAHGRLPWISTKTPSWAAMAAGTYDAQIDEMLRALDALPGPVWLTIHHEPEGGGGVNAPDDPAGPAGHVAMNRRVRERMTALGVDNVALAPILMTYTWTAASGRNPDVWWAPGIYDFLGVDHYKDAQASLLDSTWSSVRRWAAARSVDVAVGEWGMRGTDAAAGARVRAWYEAAIASNADGAGARTVGLSAFDSNLNSSTGGWELMGEQLTVFRQLLGDPRTASILP
ncbi:MAG: hypothetical protein HOV81_08850 [Kofleriaceae bacterium]|nr:hypothetical protein [Kofleriaceae bacterium]